MKISGGIFDKNEIKSKLENLEKETSKKEFWKDQKKVKKILKEKKIFENILSSYNSNKIDIINLKELKDLGVEEKDDQILKDCEIKINLLIKEIKKNEINCFLSDENDKLDIYLEIHAGAGGTESQDWADMLRRMYLKWFDKKQFKYEFIITIC